MGLGGICRIPSMPALPLEMPSRLLVAACWAGSLAATADLMGLSLPRLLRGLEAAAHPHLDLVLGSHTATLVPESMLRRDAYHAVSPHCVDLLLLRGRLAIAPQDYTSPVSVTATRSTARLMALGLLEGTGEWPLARQLVRRTPRLSTGLHTTPYRSTGPAATPGGCSCRIACGTSSTGAHRARGSVASRTT